MINILIILNRETPRIIRKAVSDIVGEILKVSEKWEGFWQYLLQLVKSELDIHREVFIS